LGGKPCYVEKVLGNDVKLNVLTLLFTNKPHNKTVEIRTDADIYFGKLDAGKQLVHQTSTGRGQWVHVISGDVTVAGENLKPGDGLAIENSTSLELQSQAGSEFLLFDLN